MAQPLAGRKRLFLQDADRLLGGGFAAGLWARRSLLPQRFVLGEAAHELTHPLLFLGLVSEILDFGQVSVDALVEGADTVGLVAVESKEVVEALFKIGGGL